MKATRAATIDEYIRAAPAEGQPHLRRLHVLLKRVATFTGLQCCVCQEGGIAMRIRSISYIHAVARRVRRSPMLAAMMLYSVYLGVVVSMTILAVTRASPTAIIALN